IPSAMHGTREWIEFAFNAPRAPALDRGPRQRLFESSVSRLRRFSHRLMKLVPVKFAFPSADDQRCNTIADEVGQRPALAHKLVDSNKDGERLDRNVGDDR